MDLDALNERQRRTYTDLIGGGADRPIYDTGVRAYLTERMEAAIGTRTTPGGAWVGKGPLNALQKCVGMFAAAVRDEGEEFRHSDRSAVGALLHRAIRFDVEGRGGLQADATLDVCREAVAKLCGEGGEAPFRAYWEGESEAAREAILAEAAALLGDFREAFPPIVGIRKDLAPSAEVKLRAELADQQVAMSGVVDLALGRRVDGKAARLLIDHKTGAARPEYAEDMRFYALLHTLKHGDPPFRVASFFVETGEWQAEDVDIAILEHAADRAARGARLAIDILEDDEPTDLTPGAWCGWCPRATTCPSSTA